MGLQSSQKLQHHYEYIRVYNNILILLMTNILAFIVTKNRIFFTNSPKRELFSLENDLLKYTHFKNYYTTLNSQVFRIIF